MLLAAIGSVLLGFALSWAAVLRLADRLPERRAVFVAGPLGALFGAYLTQVTLGPGHVPAMLTGAALVGAVTLSLLVRPTRARLRGRALPF
ncbi:hypothetical protein ABZ714_15665 [Streptomyces sp. NPDC006798]|uniref:hypothetical protein n=1 Tax=Streptomyces sp. NPDC006798 TaxID=3155462 RepID=UPI0033EBC93F